MIEKRVSSFGIMTEETVNVCGTCKFFNRGWTSKATTDGYALQGKCERPRFRFRWFEAFFRMILPEDYDCYSSFTCKHHSRTGDKQ